MLTQHSPTIVELLVQIRDGLANAARPAPCPPTPSPAPAPPPTQPFGGVSLCDLAAVLKHTTSDAAHERVLLRFTKGTGRFSKDKRFITLNMTMYGADLRPDGHHEGVWEALFPDLKALMAVPRPPAPSLNAPQGPVEHLPPLAATKAIWAFGDGSAVYAVGPALTHLVPLGDGSSNFSVACSQIVTNGTGKFAGVHGLKQSLGATKVPPGVNFFDPNLTVEFEAHTVDTFRIVWPNGVPKNFDIL